jgi:hypothetical protein
MRKLLVAVGASVITVLAAPSAHADAGSHLAAAHAEPALAGFTDFALMVGGAKLVRETVTRLRGCRL